MSAALACYLLHVCCLPLKLSSWCFCALQRVRYRYGVPVTTNGAKYITESLKEEWDGGSRGRVKTKGKRGAGFA